MLPAAHRLTAADDFRACVRNGARAGGPLLVVHLASPDAPTGPHDADRPARAGFVVARNVGTATVRNRVKRRLRHLVRERLTELPPAALLVVRAQPAAAGATYAELGAELDRCLRKCLAKVGRHGDQTDADQTDADRGALR